MWHTSLIKKRKEFDLWTTIRCRIGFLFRIIETIIRTNVSKPKLWWRYLKTPMSLMIDSTRSGWVRIERWMKGWWMLMKDWSGAVTVVGSWVMRDVWSLNSIIGTSTICIAIWNIYIWFIIIWNFYFLEIHISIYDSYLWLLFVVYIDVLSILQ